VGSFEQSPASETTEKSRVNPLQNPHPSITIDPTTTYTPKTIFISAPIYPSHFVNLEIAPKQTDGLGSSRANPFLIKILNPKPFVLKILHF
jgi:hypothetical protein